jgi:hypothetical protein
LPGDGPYDVFGGVDDRREASDPTNDPRADS